MAWAGSEIVPVLTHCVSVLMIQVFLRVSISVLGLFKVFQDFNKVFNTTGSGDPLG